MNKNYKTNENIMLFLISFKKFRYEKNSVRKKLGILGFFYFYFHLKKIF